MPHVLIVEDEPAIADTLVVALQLDGFTTQWVSLAREALTYAQTNHVDLMILDVGLPDVSGFEACKQLRRTSELPVLFLTARADEIDRIVGLEIGADDYVTKPFSPREVAARVRTILKRVQHKATQTESNEFEVDQERMLIRYCQRALSLTRHEFRLLSALITQPKKVLSRERLLQATGAPDDAGYERNIDSHIKALRAKLKQIDPTRDPIQTHRGFGYSYQPQDKT